VFLAQGKQVELLIAAHQREQRPDLESVPYRDEILRELSYLEAARGVTRLEHNKLDSPIPFRRNLNREHMERLDQCRGGASIHAPAAQSILDISYRVLQTRLDLRRVGNGESNRDAGPLCLSEGS
jgi:hypothetical protein